MSSPSDDDELPALNTARTQNGNGSDVSDLGDGELQTEMDDLFGDEVDDDAEKAASRRQLDDEDLDSGDDEGRTDRAQQEEAAEPEMEDENAQQTVISRYPAPEPTDGEGYLVKIPRFAAIDPVAFSVHTFQPPITDHHSKGQQPSPTFSAYKTAQSTVRWRHSPSNPSELQSNARILRWSDGSLTLQLATDATTQYQITPKALAPPQRNPKKPTPTSMHDKTGRTTLNAPYDEKSDSFTYLSTASYSAYMVRILNKITTSLQVVPSTDGANEALERLQSSMAAFRGGVTGSPMVTIEQIAEDPELAKKKAEMAEKEKMKAQKRIEGQAIRERERSGKVYARGSRAGGLTVGGLEDEEGGGGYRRAPKKQARRQRRDDVTDSEDERYRGKGGREDEYDLEDGFLAGSDEDEDRDAEGEDDEDIDEVIESREKEQRATARERVGTPKRDRSMDEALDEPAPAHNSPARTKRRRIVSDDDDDE